ncbi:peptidase S28 [Rhexocercosporidium sp. MPI-PUGE-AT-0058]|nr:peptidase S28 [Rhexocercosporidium sp. MPI-PUGE-AT-0058]
MKTSIIIAVAALACHVSSNQFLQMRSPPALAGHARPEAFAAAFAAAPVNTTGSGFFTQLLDHDNPSKGTFQQKFWWNTEYWAGPGSPIFLFTPGGAAAKLYAPGGWLTNGTTPGRYAQEMKGAVVMIELRYWGDSSPYHTLNPETLQYMTLHQTVKDLTNFANNVVLPFDPTGCSSNADKVPWVFSGCSYAGSVAAWTEKLAPGTFWAYYATSAPAEAIYDYWQYSVPAQQGMPKNCSKDINTVVEYMDNIFMYGEESEKLALKAQFGLESLDHYDDLMALLADVLGNLWQYHSFSPDYYYDIFRFCDMIENVEAGAAVSPDANGVGLPKALSGYAKWVNETVIPGYCQYYGYTDERETKCMDTHDPTNLMFTNFTVQSPSNLQWKWMLCNEAFAWWQTGAPINETTLISRLVTAEYFQKQCALYFPAVNGFTYGSNKLPQDNVDKVNKLTEGWKRENSTRLIWTNGQFDPWKNSGVSSDFRPGGPYQGSPTTLTQIIPGGMHCSDYFTYSGTQNSGVQTAIDNQMAQIIQWVSEFPKN